MAILAPVAANVQLEVDFTQKAEITLGETGDHGQWVYWDTATKTFKLADNSTAIKAAVTHMLLTPGDSGEKVLAAKVGAIVNLGLTHVLGDRLCISSTPGAIILFSELLSGQFISYVSLAYTTSLLQFIGINTGVAKA